MPDRGVEGAAVLYEDQISSGSVITALRAPRVGVPFAHSLRSFGENLAIVAPNGTKVSYSELADRVDDVCERLGGTRRLVMLQASNDLEPLVVYLAALKAGHPLIVAPSGDRTLWDRLRNLYDPDVLVDHSGELEADSFTERRPGTAHDLHPELAVLLTTSGSTGSPKLVRLSRDNIESNARAIASYLDIKPTDRAATSLPMHYCYGLSVVNSNLASGAALLVSENSVVDPCFWSRFKESGGTSIAGVPYTFELLESIGFDSMDLPTLRYITQAGGRLSPERVKQFAGLGSQRGWQLYVMYGQTEATARMAYLPPEKATTRPECIGVPIPGGTLRIDLEDGTHEGELVYQGPNVMLGYAEQPADLSLGRVVHELRTGDIGRRESDGLIRIVGRKSRLAKLFGLRLDLDHIESRLGEQGQSVLCATTDERLIVATDDAESVSDIGRMVSEELRLPRHAVAVVHYEKLPRLPSGKPDYRKLASGSKTPTLSQGNLRSAYAQVLNRPSVKGSDTFISLGGDSLSYVEMASAIEDELGYAPPGWHKMPISELEAQRPRHSRVRKMETGVVLRALATILVVASHVHFNIEGSAHVLLALAGWNYARFALDRQQQEGSTRSDLRGLGRVLVPSLLWIGLLVATRPDYGITNLLLLSGYVGGTGIWYWYIEVLAQSLMLFALVFSFRRVRALQAARPFAFAAGVVFFGLVLRYAGQAVVTPVIPVFTLHMTLWLFALGWMAQRATTLPQRLMVVACVLAFLPGYFGEPGREALVGLGILLLVFVNRVPVPAPLNRVVSLIAGASLYIYLTHFVVFPPLMAYMGPVPVIAVTLAIGVAIWIAVDRGVVPLFKQKVLV